MLERAILSILLQSSSIARVIEQAIVGITDSARWLVFMYLYLFIPYDNNKEPAP